MAKTITASINGVSIKNLEYFEGHEGGCYQGNVYLDGKLLGFWSQDSWGGPDNFDFNMFPVTERAKEYYRKNPKPDSLKFFREKTKPEDLDFDNLPVRDVDTMIEVESLLLEEIAEMANELKYYKKWSKDGYTVLAKLKCVSGLWPIPKENGTIRGFRNTDDARKSFKEITDKYPYARLFIYEKPEDFIK